ncbi:fimbrial protein [Escherichia sp. MOD1-EC5948]|uniref:F4 family fimbrial subunit n=1 Tax=Escherichia sp. MOD1-EC5948 TaxID=2093877 RepID=UPI000CF7585D|nr:fimbrial protein [Escherichia sp. MOD1-EC5948]
MKKTLIALAVAASAAVSGSAMAWTANGTGGSVDLGGTLTPVEKVTPWEVKVGAAVNDLNAPIQKGQKEVRISSLKSIEILGIRTKEKAAFVGANGIAPQIDYGAAIDATKFSNGETKLTLVVKDDASNEIGKLESSLFAQAYTSEKSTDGGDAKKFLVFAAAKGNAYYGGLGQNSGSLSKEDLAAAYMPDAEANWVNQGGTMVDPEVSYFSNPGKTYNSYYFSVIKPNQAIKIALNEPVSGDAPIQWKASLPVTVSYQ